MASHECLDPHMFIFSMIAFSGYFLLKDGSSLNGCKSTIGDIKTWYVPVMYSIKYNLKHLLKKSPLISRVQLKKLKCSTLDYLNEVQNLL